MTEPSLRFVCTCGVYWEAWALDASVTDLRCGRCGTVWERAAADLRRRSGLEAASLITTGSTS